MEVLYIYTHGAKLGAKQLPLAAPLVKPKPTMPLTLQVSIARCGHTNGLHLASLNTFCHTTSSTKPSININKCTTWQEPQPDVFTVYVVT